MHNWDFGKEARRPSRRKQLGEDWWLPDVFAHRDIREQDTLWDCVSLPNTHTHTHSHIRDSLVMDLVLRSCSSLQHLIWWTAHSTSSQVSPPCENAFAHPLLQLHCSFRVGVYCGRAEVQWCRPLACVCAVLSSPSHTLSAVTGLNNKVCPFAHD